jgi:formylglycine-generating enzyme required for sulfatase activity
MPDQQLSKPQARGRKLGHGANHRQNLLIVLELLLDLAGENSIEVWKTYAEKTTAHQCKDLQQALAVRWDENKENHLLVTSARRDPAGRDDASIPGETSSVGTLEAIWRCLDKTNRKLVHTGRQVDTKSKTFEIDQIRNALNLLLELQLLKEDKFPKRSDKIGENGNGGDGAFSPAALQGGGVNSPVMLLSESGENRKNDSSEKRSNNPYWSFWIDFSSLTSNSKNKCIELVNERWEKKWGEKKAAPRTQTTIDPEVKLRAELDDWVSTHLESWRARFDALPDVKDRRIHVPLKATIKLAADVVEARPGEAEPREPTPEDIEAVVAAKGSQMLLIWEEGGAGKTSLAFEIARWGLNRQLADHHLLPVLVDLADGDGDVVERLHKQLIHVDEELTLTFVRDLWRHRRLLPIIDHVSELTDNQRQWLRKALRPHLVLLTSRQREGSLFPGWSISEILPQRLEGKTLFNFFEAYLAAKGKQADGDSATAVLSPEDQIRTRDLLERMVGNKPITVLLVWMVINKAIDHIAEGRVDLLPSSVPDLMLDYVERSGKAIALDNQRLADGTPLQPGWIQASLKALALAAHRQDDAYRPQNFEWLLAQKALSKIPWDGQALASETQQRNLLLYLHEKLNLLQSKGGSARNPSYRLALDPLADYMAALALMEELNGGRDPAAAALNDSDHYKSVRQWLDLLDRRLGREQGDAGPLMRGFLAACRDGYKELLSRAPSSLEPTLQHQWQELTFEFARLAGIDPQEERKLEARHLIRRHAGDLFWANPELLPKAIAELSAFAQEFAGGRELEEAQLPLARTMEKATLPEAVRTAAAEALGRIGGGEAAKALVRMIQNVNEASVAVRRAAAEALGLVDASPDNPAAHWDLLKQLLADEANHLYCETDQAVIDARLPLLQGASRGLQRLAGRCSPFSLPVWGAEKGLEVPMLTLTTSSGALTTEVVTVKVRQLPLPGGLLLELVAIAAGEFLMGSPAQEKGRNAYSHRPEATNVNVEAQRRVRLPAFAMARTPISQSQWRAVADLPQVERPLSVDPAQAKGAELPVECVSWNDAREWCARLNRYLGLQLAEASVEVMLPSEAQWEYACRAGSDSAFHFGDTLDPAWANYDGNYSYGAGKIGVYLNRTSPVGAYGLVNSWGLADLHGGVWEWCQDLWHPSPERAPSDGSAWLEPAADLPEVIAQSRLLRGGSWNFDPGNCRSAFRNNIHPGHQHYPVGFRVCCLPQD